MGHQDEFIKDRGNIKWTAMMLPEHRKMLHELGVREREVEPPSKSEDDLAILAGKIAWAFQGEEIVTITFWENKRRNIFVGKVKRIDANLKAILMEGCQGERSWIPAQYIFDCDQ